MFGEKGEKKRPQILTTNWGHQAPFSKPTLKKKEETKFKIHNEIKSKKTNRHLEHWGMSRVAHTHPTQG